MKMKKFFLIALFLLLTISVQAKQSDLDGTWYSSTPRILKAEINDYAEDAKPDKVEGKIVGAIVPHAGIRFSGPIAVYSYKVLQELNPETVVIVGFTHNAIMPGTVSVFTDEYFGTPLGKIYVNREITDRLLQYSPDIKRLPSAFDSENSIELQIPYIQTLLGENVKIVILAICDQSIQTCKLLSDALNETLKDQKNLVLLASTDMSHYKEYSDANKMDVETINLLEEMDPDKFYFESLKKFHEDMCGYGAVYTVMRTCKNFGADTLQLLAYANSGDTYGKREKVVGYLSAVFTEKFGVMPEAETKQPEEWTKTSVNELSENNEEGSDMLDKELKIMLLEIARNSIKYYLDTGMSLDVQVEDEKLKENMGAFVTLHKDGDLRGCIGNMIGIKPLYQTVRDMAISAAFSDPRFHAITKEELQEIDIEISVLSPMEKIDDYEKIKMGTHGVMVQAEGASGVYLPQVATETGWTKEEFMNSLCGQKAGMPFDYWKTGDCDMFIFRAEVFGEKDFENKL